MDDPLHLLPFLDGHDRFVSLDPGAHRRVWVADEPRPVAPTGVVGVEQYFLLAELAPLFEAGVPLIVQDGLDGGDLPSVGQSMSVAALIVSTGTQDLFLVELGRDLTEALAGEDVLEDPSDNRRGRRIGFEPLQLEALGCLAWVGVRGEADGPIAERRSPALVAPLLLDLGRHAETHAFLNSLALSSTHTARKSHQHVVR